MELWKQWMRSNQEKITTDTPCFHKERADNFRPDQQTFLSLHHSLTLRTIRNDSNMDNTVFIPFNWQQDVFGQDNQALEEWELS